MNCLRLLACCTGYAAWLASAHAETAESARSTEREQKAARASLALPDGYVVDVVAAAPLVRHPLMADFDDQGRLYVAASCGENLPREELEKRLPNFVQRLEDVDGDGRFDSATTFADKMTFPQGCLWHEGSLYVASSGAIWKLTDTDDDGVADEREKLIGDFGYTGNAADVHGPFRGPDGRLYWCEGRHGHRIESPAGELISQGKAARIFSSRFDGTDIQTWCTGGMDNPVEVVFTPAGEMLGTVNLMYGRPRGDCLVHWQWGGVYPRRDFAESLRHEFVFTGELLPEIHNFGHTAVSGLCRVPSAWQATDAAAAVLVTQFNTNRVVQVNLQRSGSTFAVDTLLDLAVADSKDFHPTDVLEAPDGSILIIDTGGWFRIGCPASQVAKAHIEGAIYRVRRSDRRTTGPATSDPDGGVRSRQAQIWEARRDATDDALRRIVARLDDPAPTVRQTAARALHDWPDRAGRQRAVEPLLAMLNEGGPAERRVAAAVLGRTEEASRETVPALLNALAHEDNDRLARHALVDSLIRLGNREQLAKALLDPREAVSSGAAIALEQLRRPTLEIGDSHWLQLPAPALAKQLSEAERTELLQIESDLPAGDPQRGQRLFADSRTSCSKCHRISGTGGAVGPDLTTIGRIRSRRDLLESILFPSASFARGFETYVVATETGKAYSGIILGEGADTLRLGIDSDHAVEIAYDDVADVASSNVSIMPTGLLKELSLEELADLVAYLESCDGEQ